LLQRAEIAKLQRPNERTLAAVREFVKGTAIEDANIAAIPIIEGRAQSYLDDKLDLVTLFMQAERDYLSLLLHACWPSQQRRSHDPFDRTTFYRNSQISQAVSTIGLVLAAVLLIAAIIHLYLVVSIAAKLGFLTMYTLLFALSVAFCTNARRVEVFAATAAYAAVLVVFVSGDSGGNKAEQCLIQLEGGIFKMIKCPR
jgi:Flp pilus assembly protein TadB